MTVSRVFESLRGRTRFVTALLVAGAIASCRDTGAPALPQPQQPVVPHSAAAPATQPAVHHARVDDGPSPERLKAIAADLRAIYSKPSQQWPKPTLEPGIEHREIGKLPEVPFPVDNPYSKPKEALGKLLFFDPRLSGSGQIACASCHDPDLAWADGRTVSFGHARTPLKRNSPSILFAAYSKSLFWDGRAATLEAQFPGPVSAHDEMNGEAPLISKRLDAVPEYRQQFKEIFNADHATLNDAARAVATFERATARLTGRSKFDKFLAGQTDALSDGAVRGLHIFRTTGRCMNCHNGPEFTDGQFHDLGLSYYGRKELQDLGRYTVTKDPKDVGRFRTPSLRNVARTAPYMHNGIFGLDGVIAAYNAGMANPMPRNEEQKKDPLFPKKDKLLRPLGLGSNEKAYLKEFLESLSEPPLRIRPPALPKDPSSAQTASTDPNKK